MYDLTLTKGERDAIDWVGHRGRHGTELYKLLWGHCGHSPEDADWDHDGPITFHMGEPQAWTIHEIISEGLTCFGTELVRKLHRLQDRIV